MKKLPLAVALIAANQALLSGVAIAEDSIEEVIVEGSYLSMDKLNSVKSPTPIIDVPQSLSIITAAQISKQGFDSVADIINYTPGVNNTQGEGHRDAVVFRGVRSTADFFIDGARDDVQYYRPLYNLDQVEILRGPNALLFGRGGTGGVLNRVSKKGQLDKDFTKFSVSADSFSGVGIQIDTNTSINEDVALRINGMYEALEGDRDHFDGDRYAINPTLHVKLGEETALDVSYEYVDFERFIDRGIPTGADGRPVEALDGVVFGDRNLNTTGLEANVFRATLQHRFSDSLKGNFNVTYGDYDKLYQNLYASGYDQANTPDRVTLDGYLDTTQRENLTLSANLVGEFDTGSIEHTLIAGVEYGDTSSNQDRYNAFWDTSGKDKETILIDQLRNLVGGVGVNAAGQATTVVFNNPDSLNDDTHVEIEVASVYIQDQIALSENFDIVLGARFDSFDIDVLNVKADNERRTRKDEEISPRAGLVYKPQENISIYASYSESFLPRSGEQFANINGDANNLDPDVFENSEIGLKWDFEGGLSLTAAYFENEQTRAARDNETGENFEVRGLEVEGYEIQLQGNLTEQISIQAGYSNLDGKTGSGAQPRELPENMASVWAGYQATDKFGLGLGVIYQDESLIKDGSDLTLPCYTRVDAMMSYQVSDELRLQLNIENLTDEEYFPTAHSTHQVTVGQPMNARLTVSGSF
ncbi:TonB-dependent siderophore receptor [uncultured Pseudoteredinibacter sp.]|uniref:TonB-dependent receptor n=1 Tax=uncultured Pseudoteredinibacter sp. TaxID=1641701 RepID=UPI002603F1FF|nr:TonB-dependent siderophore receptor [uncultured Pseudoteredinibacter sp.]